MTNSSAPAEREAFVTVPPISKPQTAVAAVNGRYRAHKVAGQQRYANELVQRLAGQVHLVEPEHPLKGMRGHVWEQSTLPRTIGNELLWSPCQAGPAFRKRHVVTFHDIFALENPEWFSRQYALVYKYLLPLLARNASRLISVSEFTKRRMMAVLGTPEEKIEVIHSGISDQFQPQSLVRVEQMRRELKLPFASYALSVSSLEPRKNVPRLLEAWRRIQSELPEDCWLVLSGANGSAAVFAGEKLDVSGLRVHFTGYVPDELLAPLYSGARAFLYPSLAEGFGFPVLEAMACGTPSLTSSLSSLPEVAGDAAAFVDPESVPSIAKGIRDILLDSELRAAVRERGLRQASRFTWNRTASQTLKVLQQEHERGR